MADSKETDLRFIENLEDYSFYSYPGFVTHILCLEGSISFNLRHTRYNVSRGDYIILTTGIFPSAISLPHDCRYIAMTFPEIMVDSSFIQNDYGVTGHLSLLQNPVLRLTERDFANCLHDMSRIRERLGSEHLFKNEMIQALLKAHVLDLYDIHARNNPQREQSSRPAMLMREFIGKLTAGEYRIHRSVDFYAEQLCLTPHYLSEISKKFSGQPASYWIDHFTVRELSRMLADESLTLNDIAFSLNFSSLSHLSRYVSKHLGVTPSEFRKTLWSK